MIVRCDVLSRPDQVNLFKAALSKAPSRTMDIDCANAELGGMDEITAPPKYNFASGKAELYEPNLEHVQC